jgi:transcriptional regulator with GAF, ATPase, and Fis domain
MIYIGIVVSMVGVFLADLYTPLGVAVWVVYVIPVALSLWVWWPVVPPAVATMVTILMVITFLTDAAGIDRETARANRIFGIVTVWVIGIVGYQFVRTKIAIRRQDWIQTGQVGLSVAMNGELRIEQLGDGVLRFLAEYLNAHAAAMFVWNSGTYRRVATYGVPGGNGTPEAFERGEGLLGQAAKDRRTFLLQDVPEGYLTVGSALGRGKPRHLLISPAAADGRVNSIIELGFLHAVDDATSELMHRVSESIAVAVRSADYRAHLQNLLEETQRQAEELQTQGEELRVTNEELEEQSRALKESQARLELQQAELEQTNSQLEEQTQLLEVQRDDLEKS